MYFKIIQNICIYIMSYLGDETLKLTMKFIYASYHSSAYSPKVISYNMLSDFVHEVKFHGVEFSSCAFTQVLKKSLVWEHLGH